MREASGGTRHRWSGSHGWPALLLLPMGIGLLTLMAASGAHDGPPRRTIGRSPVARGLDALDAPLRLHLDLDLDLDLERAVAQSSPSHQPHARAGHVALGAASIDRAGAHVGGVSIALAAMGRGEALVPLDAHATPRIAGPEVRIARAPGVSEWWRSLPSGLEQGVTIEARAPGEGELVLVMRAGEGVRAELEGVRSELEGEAISLVAADGRPLARYGQLSVFDRDGAHVPARLAVLDGHIAIRVDDHAASYPLVVDPLVVAVEARLLASDGTDGDAFGAAVSLSADGTRALVGADQDDGFRGSAYVFLRSGTSWTEEARLTASDGDANDRFGVSVALSADGRCAVVGAHWDAGEQGAAYVFRRSSGSAWSQESRLTAATRISGARFGVSVGLDGTGARAVVGAEGESGRGAAYFFLRSGATWSQETRVPPAGFPPAVGDRYGISVAMASSGERALVGAPGADASRGVADAYILVTPGWGRVATLDAGVRTVGATFGWSVAASGDGSRALVGGIGAGAVHAFTWSVDGFTLTPEATLTVTGTPSLGSSVSLSTDGSRALAGAYNGGASTWARAGTSWALEATLPSEGALFGRSVALAGTGTRAIAGASGASTGTALVFGIGLDGIGCTAASDCGSGFCVDGVCCNAACGGGATDDCQACSSALTSAANGTCAPASATALCRSAAGPCDLEERCNGTSTTCPADAIRLVGTTCAPSTGAACDVEDVCTGAGIDCPTRFVAAGTVCLAASGEICDTDDVCTGASGECLPRFLVGVECRPSAGACDLAEMCGSDSPCPTDRHAAAGTVCRASTDLVCDPLESCDGAGAACPADQITCVADAGRSGDTGPSPPDAGVPGAAAGCGCRVAAAPLSGWLVTLGLALAAGLRERRRSERRRRRDAAAR